MRQLVCFLPCKLDDNVSLADASIPRRQILLHLRDNVLGPFSHKALKKKRKGQPVKGSQVRDR